jgi:hypothetical protein
MAVRQLELFASEVQKPDTTTTFGANLALPIHRWFRYSAGFSASWVRELLLQHHKPGGSNVLDPFVGSGTVLIESMYAGDTSIGLEAHPFIARIAQAKLDWNVNPQHFSTYCQALMATARTIGGTSEGYPMLITRCFPPGTLAHLDALKQAFHQHADDSPYAELAWLALGAIIRECSPVGTAQWQYVLPKKRKANPADPFTAFAAKVALMCSDMTIAQRHHRLQGKTKIVQEDARCCASVPSDWADLIITSPPYANNYDYADATRLEMSFWGDLSSWGDLHQSVRQFLIPSCTQHVARQVRQTHVLLGDPLLEPIVEEITTICQQLEMEREQHGGKKPYHTMIAAYFQGMAQVWQALRRVARHPSQVCFVIGDSAPYGIYVPVERWLGELALAAGFTSYRFEKTRDRNTKWKNRKHRVPLHEGHLWVQG